MTDERPDNSSDERIEPGSVAELEADVGSPPERVVRKGGTFRAFRYRDYTLFWSGALVSNIGSWMQMTALALVVYELRRSELDLGVVNLIGGLPVFFLAIPAGVLADRLDRRRLLMWSQAAMMVQAAALGVLYATGNLSPASPVLAITYISALGLLGGVLSALTFPAWQSAVPDIIPREDLLNGIALNAAQFQSARSLGPLAAAALIFIGAGYQDIFYINAASFLFVIAALAVMRFEYSRPRPAPDRHENAWRTLTAGLAYARENRAVGMLILSVAMMTVFAMPYMMLLPAVVDKALLGAALTGLARKAAMKQWVGYIMAANGFGAVVGALAVASLPRNTRRGPLVGWSLTSMAVLLIAFSFSRSLILTTVISCLTGAAFLTSTSLVNTSIQACVPHHLRGRVMALFVMAFMGIMPISSGLFGPLGQAIGPTWAVLAGAVVLLGYCLLLLARPAMLDADGDCEDRQDPERAAPRP